MGIAAACHLLRHRPGGLWALGWAAVLASGVLLLAGPEPFGEPLLPLLGAFIPGAQLAGALALALGRAPALVVPAALGVGLLRAAGDAVLPGWAASWIGVGLEPAAILAAAGVVAGVARRETWPPSSFLALPPLLVLMAALDGLSALALTPDGGLPAPLVVAWAALTAALLPLQLHATARRSLRRQRRLRRRTEEELRESQARFRALTESAFDLVAELDGDERFTYVSPRYQEVLGHPPASLLGRRPYELVHPDDRDALARFAAEADALGAASGLVLRARRADGGWVWVENAARTFCTPDGERRWVLNSRDVTRRLADEAQRERARARLEETVAARTDALHASEARFRALADHAPELISEFDAQGRYLFANAAFRELLGREPADLIGSNPEALIHPEDLPSSRRGMARALRQEGPAHAVHRLRHADGTWRWFDNTGRAYRTAQGELRFVSIGRDVTEARRAEVERRRLEGHVQEVQRLESLGLLAGGIAHDFHNLLAVILGNVALLEVGAAPGSDDAARLRRIRAAARHAQGLTEQMLTYAGRTVAKLRPLDLPTLVRETEELLRAAVSGTVRLEIQLAADLPRVDADPTQLRQVLLNLVTNASEALGERGGRILVRADCRTLDAAALAEAFGGSERRPGRWVALEVADDGPGMDEARRRRIFEPFYSTKRSGRGLGLAAVLGIAAAHRGLVKLESAPGAGSVFTLLVPPGGAAPAVADAPPARPERPGAGLTVLVVDDEDGVREVAQAFLERAGFRVLAAADGEAALACLRSDPSVDAVLLDLAMPDPSGPETLRALRAVRPGLPVVIASGYTRDVATERVGADEPFGFVAKPYDAEGLVAALCGSLDDGPEPEELPPSRPPRA